MYTHGRLGVSGNTSNGNGKNGSVNGNHMTTAVVTSGVKRSRPYALYHPRNLGLIPPTIIQPPSDATTSSHGHHHHKTTIKGKGKGKGNKRIILLRIIIPWHMAIFMDKEMTVELDNKNDIEKDNNADTMWVNCKLVGPRATAIFDKWTRGNIVASFIT